MGDVEAEKEEILPTGDIRPAKVERKEEEKEMIKEKKVGIYKSWGLWISSRDFL
jgi:hypothetical protein